MNQHERYFFDLNGYLVVEDALSRDEVAVANAAIDHYAHDIRPRTSEQSLAGGRPALTGTKGRLELPRRLLELETPWCEIFRSLLDHSTLHARLEAILGPGFRLDHLPMFFGMERGCEGFTLHGGGAPYDPSQCYVVRDGKIFTGLTAACWQLTDMLPGDGGFCCIPGSHKASFPCPEDIRGYAAWRELVVQPRLPAGSLLIFTEALTHGTLPWTAPHQRRSVLYKYAPGFVAWAPAPRFDEAFLAQLTPRQRELLAPPAHAARQPPPYD